MADNQLDKFKKKWGKNYEDINVIKKANIEREAEENKTENKASKIAEEKGVKTEDIFAIITRESIGSFIKMWNNSMQNVITDTMRDEFRQIIREEMADAFRGIVKGITSSDEVMEEMMKGLIKEIIAPSVETKVEETVEEVIKETVEEPEEPKQTEEEVDEEVLQTQRLIQYQDDETIDLIFKSVEAGVQAWKISQFTKQGREYQAAYSRFVYHNKGMKNGWKRYVEYLLNK